MRRVRPALLLAPLALLTLGVRTALAADPAALSVVLFDPQRPLAAAELRIDGHVQARTNADGAAVLRLEAGKHRLSVHRDGRELAAVDLDLEADEDAELILTVYPDDPGATPGVVLESSHAGRAEAPAAPAAAGPPGVVAGRVRSAEDDAPVAGAHLYIAGTPVDAVTDAQGHFEIALAPGRYVLSIVAARFGARTLEAIELGPEQTVHRDIELTPAGLELPEFVVLEPFVEGSLAAFVEERRSSAAVADVLGAEQIARAGDSDAAGALKRVAGLTLVDGKFVFVRGLGERYSSVLFNGAQIPSPDPTRRVVPLDLFPTSILQGVVVQKTFSPEMPGEFGGGTIQLRTVGVPEAPFFKLSIGAKATGGATFAEGLNVDGGRRDWTGFDDGARAEPAVLRDLRERGLTLRRRNPANPDGLTDAQIEAAGEDLIGVLNIGRKHNRPDGSFGLSGGTRFDFGDGWSAGFVAAMRYENATDNRDEVRRTFQASDAGLQQRGELDLQRTLRNIDLGGYAAVGLAYADLHTLRFSRTLVRQTEEEARISRGEVDSQDLQRNLIEWTENDLKISQAGGTHTVALPLDSPLQPIQAEWNYTEATAGRYAPNTRELRFDFDEAGERTFSLASDSNNFEFADLHDRTRSWDAQVRLPLKFGNGIGLTLGLTKGALERDRDSFIRRFQFNAGRGISPDVLRQQNPEDIFADANIGRNLFALTEITREADTYFAAQDLDYRGISLDLDLFDTLRLTGGVREEDNVQQVATFSVVRPNDPPVIGLIDEKNRLPAAAATWSIAADQQLRLGYSKTLSRPDFREQTASPFLDPLLDVIAFGRPDLRQATITNYDARWEYYFSPTESLSLALFRKEFDDPIEKQLLPGGGSVLLTLANAKSATNQGVELDLYTQLGALDRWLDEDTWLGRAGLARLDWSEVSVGANFAWIDSQVKLDPAQSGFNTNLDRPLEGQSPYVLNLQLGYGDPDGSNEATLLYNVSGARIVQVGVDGQPDIEEQPFGQLDFAYKRRLGADWSLRLRLRNLLDPKSEFTQGPETVREFRKGREFAVSVEWSPF